MELNKEEFKMLVMLYAAGIDGNVHPDEVEVMLERADEATFKRMNKMVNKMGDSEVIDCIRENKGSFVATEQDRERLLNDFSSVIKADERSTSMESYMLKAVEKILKGC